MLKFKFSFLATGGTLDPYVPYKNWCFMPMGFDAYAVEPTGHGGEQRLVRRCRARPGTSRWSSSPHRYRRRGRPIRGSRRGPLCRRRYRGLRGARASGGASEVSDIVDGRP